jgi:hypothetical protein
MYKFLGIILVLTFSLVSFADEIPASWTNISLQCLPSSIPVPPTSNPDIYRQRKLFCCKSKAQELIKLNEIRAKNEYNLFIHYCMSKRDYSL